MKILLLIVVIYLNVGNLHAQNRWEKLNGPIGGVIAGLAVKGDTILAGTGYNKALIFYSTDGGKNWEQSKLELPYRISDFTFSNDGGVIAAAYSNGLYKTIDLRNWTKVYDNGEEYWSMGKDFEGNIYAGSDEGSIVSSTDNGATWRVSLRNLGRVNNFNLMDNNIFLAGAYKKILIKESTLGWKTIVLDTIPGDTFQVFSDDNNQIYGFTYGTRVVVSSDSGKTWKYLDEEGFLRYGNIMYGGLYNHRIIAACGETGINTGWGIAVSDDGGYTWRWSNKGLPPRFSTAYRLSKTGDDTYLGTNAAGVFKSTDFGDSWFPINNGITAATTLDITFDSEGTIYTANSSNGIQKSIDKGETWEVINNGLTNSYLYSIIADDNDNLIAGTAEGAFLSTDKGENWVQTADVGNNYVYKLYKDKRNRIYSLNVSGGFYRTTDLGNSWARLDNSSFERTTIRSMVVDEDGNIYVGTNGNWIYKSTDDGENWALVREGTTEPSTYFRKLEIAPNGDIYAATRGDGVIKVNRQRSDMEQSKHWE